MEDFAQLVETVGQILSRSQKGGGPRFKISGRSSSKINCPWKRGGGNRHRFKNSGKRCRISGNSGLFVCDDASGWEKRVGNTCCVSCPTAAELLIEVREGWRMQT